MSTNSDMRAYVAVTGLWTEKRIRLELTGKYAGFYCSETTGARGGFKYMTIGGESRRLKRRDRRRRVHCILIHEGYSDLFHDAVRKAKFHGVPLYVYR